MPRRQGGSSRFRRSGCTHRKCGDHLAKRRTVQRAVRHICAAYAHTFAHPDTYARADRDPKAPLKRRSRRLLHRNRARRRSRRLHRNRARRRSRRLHRKPTATLDPDVTAKLRVSGHILYAEPGVITGSKATGSVPTGGSGSGIRHPPQQPPAGWKPGTSVLIDDELYAVRARRHQRFRHRAYGGYASLQRVLVGETELTDTAALAADLK